MKNIKLNTLLGINVLSILIHFFKGGQNHTVTDALLYYIFKDNLPF